MTMTDTDKGPRPYHIRSAPARTEPSLHVQWRPADWIEPRYPGDTIMRVDMTRGDETGDVRVQWGYSGDRLKVGTFLPGVVECPPGDTPKVWPEKSEMVADKAAASKQLVSYLIAAFRDGWRIAKPWRPCRVCNDPMDCGSWATCMNGGNK